MVFRRDLNGIQPSRLCKGAPNGAQRSGSVWERTSKGADAVFAFRRKRNRADFARTSTGRPGHVTAAQHVEMQVEHALARLLLPMGQAPLGTRDLKSSGEVNSPCGNSRRQCGFEFTAQKRRPIADGAPRHAGFLSPEARSCHGRPARGNASGTRSDPPARRCWKPRGSCQGPAPWSPWR